jgi:hypothetical protein
MTAATYHRTVFAIVLCAFLSACDTTSPTPAGLAGQWTGTTSQGTPIAFTISPDQKVTSINLGYNFNGCSGSHTFSSLALETVPDVTCIPGPCSPGISSFRRFHYATGSIDGPMTSINGIFPSGVRAEGSVGFMNYPGCGSVLGVGWTATRR